jgi:hypothetical protein
MNRGHSVQIISLLTDFGLKDVYVAEMKAIILQICPEAKIIDISHNIEKFNVRMGAFMLACAAPYFPEGSIHIGVVDPGVGTERRAIIVETQRSWFVGPDNGLLMLAAEKEGIKHVYEIRNKAYMRFQVSHTFHGRDIFAPAAAYLARGIAVSEFGPEIIHYTTPEYAKAKLEENQVKGEILHIDDFGNIITNISISELEKLGVSEGDVISLIIGKDKFQVKLCSAYNEVSKGEALAIIGSHGFLEFSVNLGNAARQFKAEVGKCLKISRKC